MKRVPGYPGRLEHLPKPPDVDRLREEIIRLGPWHMDIQVTSEISTRVSLDAPAGTYAESGAQRMAFVDPREKWMEQIRAIYPDGLKDRSFLDCACNGGGYCFWAKELGAERCFGFDVHEHWIQQARWLAETRVWPSDGIEFETIDLLDLPKLGLEPFDLTLFKGILYHLSAPMEGLRIAADQTREVLLLGTGFRTDLPDGSLVLNQERDGLMHGVHGLNWYPTGPNVVRRMLEGVGFKEVKLTGVRPPFDGRRQDIGRLSFVAAKREGLLDAVPEVAYRPDDIAAEKPRAWERAGR